MVQIQTIGKLTSVKRGSHKLPRFIYHMTSSDNYEKMLSSGSIKMSEDLMCGKGIFASELYNLFKRGCKPIEGTTLIERLLQQINTHGNKIILLRIPIQSINKDKLFIRSHKTVFDFCFSPKVSNAEKALSEECRKSGNWDNYLSKLKEIISNALNELVERAEQLGANAIVGVKVDIEANSIRGEEVKLTTDDSKLSCYAIPTNEELMIALDTLSFIK